VLLGLRRHCKRLPPRPEVPTGENDFCGAVINGPRLSFRELAERKKAQMGDYDHIGLNGRRAYQKFKDRNYTEKK
jgi:hypothetical protein